MVVTVLEKEELLDVVMKTLNSPVFRCDLSRQPSFCDTAGVCVRIQCKEAWRAGSGYKSAFLGHMDGRKKMMTDGNGIAMGDLS